MKLYEYIAIAFSSISLLMSVITCHQQNTSNDIALSAGQTANTANQISVKANTISNDANKISFETNKIAKETFEASYKFDAISAEANWLILIDSYDEIDAKIEEWERSNGYKRDGKQVESMNALEANLTDLKVPTDVKRWYKRRHERYTILESVAKQYEPFKQRLAHIDFKLPSAPRIPKGSVTFKDGGGSVTFKDGGGSVTFKDEGGSVTFK